VFVGQDCYLDVAVAGAATLRLYNTGQRPGQSTRIYVEAPLAYKFADRLHEYLAFLEAGDPRRPVTDLGPLRDAGTLLTATERLANALKQGAMVKLGGRQYQPWGLRGYFLQPTLLVEGVGAERVPHENIPGPVLIVSPTTDIGAALRDSVGPSHGPLRLAAFTEQAEKLDRSLRAASFKTRVGVYVPQVDRDWTQGTTNTLDVELIQGPQPDWFPYKNRRGLKL
jgi:acyl-CoA reductase-like NAD-dependent aldehyde dehydrogenase